MANLSANITRTSVNPIVVALVGLGGFGENYLRYLLDESSPAVRLIAGADPEPWRSPRLQQLQLAGIPVYPNLDALLENHRPNLTIIAAPPQFHKRLTCQALAHESHVLCEKPVAATFRQAMEMRRAQLKTGRTVAIGFQWSFSPAIAALKQDIASGAFGRPLRLKALVLWPRDAAYYNRNSWAGRIWSAAGEPVCDNPVTNACAHYLHNMLYVLGESPAQSAWPADIDCETYRFNAIENFDTAVVRAHTKLGAEILLVASHATKTDRQPTFVYEFERATVTYDLSAEARVIARWKNGSMRDYGSLPDGRSVQKLSITLDCLREFRQVPCGIEAALPHMAIASAVQQCPISPLAALDNLASELTRCYDAWSLPGELRFDWAGRKHSASIPPQPINGDSFDFPVPAEKEHLV